MIPQKKDLFEDTTMSFGEHLDALRTHLIRALWGVLIAVAICLYFAEDVVYWIQYPAEQALKKAQLDFAKISDEGDEPSAAAGWLPDWAKNLVGIEEGPKPLAADSIVDLEVDAIDLLRQLHTIEPKIPLPAKDAEPQRIKILFRKRNLIEAVRPASLTTLEAQEGFMVYVKVALASGFLLAGPWVFYQLWMFVAAGLYPTERKLVFMYLPLSIFLFVGGAVFCFFGVIPYVLDFLFGFNIRMRVEPQLRLNDWLGFAAMLPLMFGISFQLPLVMLILEKLTLVSVTTFQTQRRMAILVIAFLSMVLTPSGDPMSMILMMVPLIVLYELGIRLCLWHKPSRPEALAPIGAASSSRLPQSPPK